MANEIVVTNAGPLIALGKLNRLDLLASLFGEVQAPSGVYEEVVTQGLARGASDARVVQLFWQQQQWPIVDVPDHAGGLYPLCNPRSRRDRGAGPGPIAPQRAGTPGR